MAINYNLDFIQQNQGIIHKELDMIQNVINRMASNSFQVRAWMIGIISFIVAFERAKLFTDPQLLFILLIPIAVFWYLDGFFLQAERKFRKMYETVVKLRREGDLTGLYELNPNRYNEQVDSILKIMFSKTLLPLYLTPILLIVAALAYEQLFK